MKDIVTLNQEIIKIKDMAELPPHITYGEYQRLLEAVDVYYNKLNETFRRKKGRVRDKLFFMMMWVTGGRVSDICNIKLEDFDFIKKELNLWVKKKDGRILVTLNDSQLLQLSNYIRIFGIKDFLFGFSRQFAWRRIKDYGTLVNLRPDLHPHHFRHGMAIYSMNNGIPIPVISARLGHSSIKTTMQMYLKVTPDIQRRFYDNLI